MSNRSIQPQHEALGTWLRALGGNDRARSLCVARGITLKAAGESLPGSGGWLVPEDYISDLLTVTERYGAFRQGADVRTIASDTVNRPRRVSGATATWLAEGATIPESNMTLDGVSASLKKLAVLLRTSSELFYDSAGPADLGSWFAYEVGLAIATAEDLCGFQGDGTSQYVGTLGLTAKLTGTAQAVDCASGHDTHLEVDSTDISNCMSAVLGSAIPNAAWYCSPLVYAKILCRLAAVTGGLVATQRPDGSLMASYLGFPVRLSGSINSVEGNGKVCLYFGDLAKAAMLCQRRNSAVLAVSTDRSMDVDQVLLRGIVREAIVIHDILPMAMLVEKT